MLGRSFTQKELQLNQLKPKQLPHKLLLQYWHLITNANLYTVLVKQETVHLSQKEDCHPILSAFRIDHFSIRNNYNEATSCLNHYIHFPVKLWNNHFEVKIKTNQG